MLKLQIRFVVLNLSRRKLLYAGLNFQGHGEDDLDEEALLAGDDEEEEDEESRSWRR